MDKAKKSSNQEKSKSCQSSKEKVKKPSNIFCYYNIYK